MNKKFSRLSTVALAGILASGVVATTAAPSFAIAGEEGTVHGKVVPGTAVWGMAQNDFLGEFKVPTTSGLDNALYLDSGAQAPRTEFNTLIKYDSVAQLNTDTMVSGQKISSDGLKQIVASMSVARSINDSKGLTDDVKELLKSYGYKGDYGQKWGLAAQGLTEKIPQKATGGSDGSKITVTQGDYVMMALSANAMNGGNPGAFPTPVPTVSITGTYDEGSSAGMTSDFNDLVSAIQKASAALGKDVASAAKIQMLTYKGNDANNNGNPSYRRALSVNQSTLLNVGDLPKGHEATPNVTTNPSATASPSSSGAYDPTKQNDAAAQAKTKADAQKKADEANKAKAEREQKAKDAAYAKSSDASKNSSAKAVAPSSASNSPSSTGGNVPSSSVTGGSVTPVSDTSGVTSTQNLDTGSSAGAQQTTNKSMLAGLFVASLAAIASIVFFGIKGRKKATHN